MAVWTEEGHSFTFFVCLDGDVGGFYLDCFFVVVFL